VIRNGSGGLITTTIAQVELEGAKPVPPPFKSKVRDRTTPAQFTTVTEIEKQFSNKLFGL